MITGKVGNKAYLDGIRGLVPCVVQTVTKRSVTVRMDAKRGVRSWHGIDEYGDWDSVEEFTHNMVVPERSIIWPDGKRKFHPTILPYRWEVS